MNPILLTASAGGGFGAAPWLGVMVLVLMVAWCWWRSEHWSPKQLRVATMLAVGVMVLANVLHLVDVMLETRGEISMRQMIWQKLGLLPEKTSGRNMSNDGSLSSSLRVSETQHFQGVKPLVVPALPPSDESHHPPSDTQGRRDGGKHESSSSALSSIAETNQEQPYAQ